MNTYVLARHAYVQALDPYAVVLDLRNDNYLAVSNAENLRNEIEGWPIGPIKLASTETSADSRVVNQLLELQIITADFSEGKTASPACIPIVVEDCSHVERDASRRMTIADMWRFLCSYADTLHLWYLRPIDARVRMIEKRKMRPSSGSKQVGLERVKELTQIFLRLRPWFYTARDRCLFDSMVLTSFLNRNGCFPIFVVAVGANPFAAHSWVQHEGCVLNEMDCVARRYSPILVI